MIIQEPIKATISFALENFAYPDAIFLSERLHAEVATDESLFLLANSYYRSGKANVAYVLLTEKHAKICKSPQCLFLLAKCCFDLKKFNEALSTLTGPLINSMFTLDIDSPKLINRDELLHYYGELSSFVAQLLGSVYVQLDCSKHASHYFALSLKINPFLWSSYEKLVQLDPTAVEVGKLLSLDNFEFKYSCGTNPLISLLNSNSAAVLTPPSQAVSTAPTHTATLSDNTNTSHTTFQTPQTPQPAISQQPSRLKFQISTPFALIKQSNENVNKLDVITPESNGNWQTMACLAPSKGALNTPNKILGRKVGNAALKSLNNNEAVIGNSQNVGGGGGGGSLGAPPANPTISRSLINSLDSMAPNRHSFGVLQLDEQSMSLEDVKQDLQSLNNNNATGRNRDAISSPTPAVKKPYTRRNIQQDLQDINIMDVSGSLSNSQSSGALRRSSRLYTNSNWVKENTTAPKASKITRTPAKRSRRTISFDKNSDQKEIGDLGKGGENMKVITSIDLTKAGIKVQRSSAHGLLELMAKFGSAYKLLAEFKCKEAIEEFQRLPSNHFTTGFVLASIGRAYFEMSKYDEAINYFKRCRQFERYRLQGMEIYSSCLWHQQKEVELSCLSQTLIDFDKQAPETWCVAGNCFSLQKEHELSIKFLKRAIQVDPDFCYAYTLLGHELVSADELDTALACFRNATRIDTRHYNAWYGIGMIYYKQEKYKHAYQNYERALKITPSNPVLMCHLAIVCHHMKKSGKFENLSSRALKLLEDASALDPSNALVKFHRASINFANENYKVAMEELEQLKQIVPKESMVYFLIGKIHKVHGETHLALMNFSWAMDLDPKGASNQIKELIDRHYGTDDEIMIHSNSNGANSNNYNIQDASTSSATNTPNTTPFQQRSTLTPAAPGVAGPSGVGTSLVNPIGGPSGASTSNINNGSNNSNNISNNSGTATGGQGRHRPANAMRRYIIHEFDDPIDEDDEDDDEEQADDEAEEDVLDDSTDLADSTIAFDTVSFNVDNGPEEDGGDDDSVML